MQSQTFTTLSQLQKGAQLSLLEKGAVPSSSHPSLPLIVFCFLFIKLCFVFCLSSTLPTPVFIYVPLNARCVLSLLPQPFLFPSHTKQKEEENMCAVLLSQTNRPFSFFYSHRDVEGFIAVVHWNHLNKTGLPMLLFLSDQTTFRLVNAV